MVEDVGGDRAYWNLVVSIVSPGTRAYQLNWVWPGEKIGKISGAFSRVGNGGNLTVLNGAEPRTLIATEIK